MKYRHKSTIQKPQHRTTQITELLYADDEAIFANSIDMPRARWHEQRERKYLLADSNFMLLDTIVYFYFFGWHLFG